MARLWLIAFFCLPACAADYSAPAGTRPAIRRPGAPSILPGGRIIAPAGHEFATGPGPFGLAISPDHRTVVSVNSGPERFSRRRPRRTGADEDAVLDASRRFGFSALRCRALDAAPPALERGFIASPVGWGHRSRSKGHAGSGLFVAGLTERYNVNSSRRAFASFRSSVSNACWPRRLLLAAIAGSRRHKARPLRRLQAAAHRPAWPSCGLRTSVHEQVALARIVRSPEEPVHRRKPLPCHHA